MPDYLGDRAAAERLAEKIRLHWASLDHSVDVRVEPFTGSGGGFALLSDLINGLPRKSP